MPPPTERNVASTTEAAAAQAQSREGGADRDRRQTPVPGRVDPFTLGDGVTRASRIDPYQRQPGDPLYRPLRIFTRDPAASLLEGSIALINLPYEPLKPGPEGRLFRVEYDDAKPVVDLEDPAVLISSGIAPSVSDSRFHGQMAYAVCSSVYSSFRAALGRDVAWGFDGIRGNGPLKLTIRPHAFDDRNAFYRKRDGTLNFGFYTGDKRQTIGNNLPGGVFYTCLSHDIVAHEVTHALLDGLRSAFTFPAGPDVLAFHEGFADLVALFQRFSYSGVLLAAIRKAGPQLETAAVLTGIAEQLGETTIGKTAVREAFDLTADGLPKRRYDEDLEPHSRGSVLVSAVFEAFTTVFKRKVQPYIGLATNGSGILPPGEVPSGLLELLAKSASRLARQFLSICIRAIDYCPPVDLRFGDYLRAMITADRELVPDDRYAIREALIDAFRRRAIFPVHVDSLSEDSLIWNNLRVSMPAVAELDFGNLKFRGDPQNASGPDELVRQAQALGNAICRPNFMQEFGLISHEEALRRGIEVEPPRIQSIRTSRRIGPNGQIVFDLVGEVTQLRTLSVSGRRMPFHGGSTIILGPEGKIRYAISKSVVSPSRLDAQIGFVSSGVGKGFWEETRMGMVPQPDMFFLLHQR